MHHYRHGLLLATALVPLVAIAGSVRGAEFRWGVNGHPGVQEGYRQVPVTTQLDLIKELGAQWYRCDWDEERFRSDPASFDQLVAEASRRNIRLLPVIFPAQSCRNDLPLDEIRSAAFEFGRAIASHFRGKISHWELDNELDNWILVRKGETCTSGLVWQWGDPSGDNVDHFEPTRYARARAELEGLHAGIKAGDPHAQTLVDFCWIHYGFLELLLARDRVPIDLVAVHWYSDMGDATKIHDDFNLVEHLQRFDRPIWFTEVNRRGGSRGDQSQEQADYLEKTARQLRDCRTVEAFFVYELLDEPYFGPDNDESHYGLVELTKGPDQRWQVDCRKPAFDRLRELFHADRCLVGVYYFAGWWEPVPNKYAPFGDDWRKQYPERTALLGAYNDQPTMDREIVAAAAGGVDFFQILWYPVEDLRQRFQAESRPMPPHVELVNEGLRLFLASPNNSKLRFTIEYVNHDPFGIRDDATWEKTCRQWCEVMQHPSYLRVAGRPVFKIHGLHAFRLQNDEDELRGAQRVRTLRKIAAEMGLSDPLIGAGVSPLGIPPANALEPFDYVTTYMEIPNLPQRETPYPYEELLSIAQQGWGDYARHCAKPYVPYLPAGWDPRPWRDPRPAFSLPDRAQWKAALESAATALEENSQLGLPTPDGRQKVLLIYAWNEFGEGGIVAPTQGDGTMKLDILKEVFAPPTAKSPDFPSSQGMTEK